MLALPPPAPCFALPPHLPVKRGKPLCYSYYGFLVYVLGICADGVLKKFEISYRAADPNSGKKRIYLSRQYTPESETPIPADIDIPIPIIEATLNKVLSTLFFPKLLAVSPPFDLADTPLAVCGPYLLRRLHGTAPPEHYCRALRRVLENWKETLLKDLLPSLCGPILASMDESPATDIVRLLRQFFAVISGTDAGADGRKQWERYPTKRNTHSYSPGYVARQRLCNTPMSCGQVIASIRRCQQYPSKGEYLLCRVILETGIAPEEACALRASSLYVIPDYSGSYALRVDHAIVSHGTRKRGDGHVRAARHSVEPLAPPDSRILGISAQLAEVWFNYVHLHNLCDNDFLIHNPVNRDRVYAPEDFSKWLDTAFSDLVPNQTIKIDGKDTKATCHVSEFLSVTNEQLLSDYGRIADEELRYQQALKPKKMDGKHYAGFDAPSAIAARSAMLSHTIGALLGDPSDTVRGKRKYCIPGQAGAITHTHFNIRIPPCTTDAGYALQLLANYGFNATITIDPYTPRADQF